MNKRQITVQKEFIKNEKAVIRELKHNYAKALEEINAKIAVLQMYPETQSKIYQITYQLQLKAQVSQVLDKLRSGNYQTVQAYLNGCYEEGFLGAIYDLQGQGVPLAFPIDQKQMVKAVQLDSKISKGLYGNMWLSMEELKKKISEEISRGIMRGDSYAKIARQLELQTGVDLRKSLRIVRTEGHRIQNQSNLDAMIKAKDAGADVVKQWDSTLDDKTRDTHVELDGQIVEIDEEFVIPSTGARAMTAGGFGDPAEDCNCRCCVVQRARWNLDDYEATKMDNETGVLLEFKESDYQSFKEHYHNELGGYR